MTAVKRAIHTRNRKQTTRAPDEAVTAFKCLCLTILLNSLKHARMDDIEP